MQKSHTHNLSATSQIRHRYWPFRPAHWAEDAAELLPPANFAANAFLRSHTFAKRARDCYRYVITTLLVIVSPGRVHCSSNRLVRYFNSKTPRDRAQGVEIFCKETARAREGSYQKLQPHGRLQRYSSQLPTSGKREGSGYFFLSRASVALRAAMHSFSVLNRAETCRSPSGPSATNCHQARERYRGQKSHAGKQQEWNCSQLHCGSLICVHREDGISAIRRLSCPN